MKSKSNPPKSFRLAMSWKVMLGLAFIFVLSALVEPSLWIAVLVAGLSSAFLFMADRYISATAERLPVLEQEVEIAKKTADKVKRKFVLSEKKSQYFEAILQNSLDPIFTTDSEHRVMRFNRGSIDLFGYEQDEILGQMVDKLFYDSAELHRLLKKVQSKGNANTMEIRAVSKHGRIIHLNLSIARMDPKNYGGVFAGCVFSCQDIGRRKAIEREMHSRANELEKLSRTDALTNLFNRRQFEEDLPRCVQSSHDNPGQILSLMMIDLDKFKVLNDSQGHQAGDQALRHLAESMRRSVREMDLCYRFGGDEFLVILRGADSAQSYVVAERIKSCYADLKDSGNETTISIGICTFNGSEGIEEFFQRTDSAMYLSKTAGGSQATVK